MTAVTWTAPIKVQTIHTKFAACVKNSAQFTKDIITANLVSRTGVPNRFKAKIPIHTNWNIPRLKQYLHNYHDLEVVEWLEFGFSISRDASLPDPQPAQLNHKGAELFPQEIENYLENEIKMGAIIGPFTIPPFLCKIGISPLSSRKKKGSHQRRVILDLSYPFGLSVNDGIPKDSYCGNKIKLTYPTIDTLWARIVQLGKNCKLYKRDLARFFNQLPLCPGDYSLIGIRWKNLFFFMKSIPMGLRSATFCAQKVTNAIVFIHKNNGNWALNYIDDFASCELEQFANKSYQDLGKLFSDIGVQESRT